MVERSDVRRTGGGYFFYNMINSQGVYILQSQKNNRFYIGSTENIQRRFKEHCDGLVFSTKNIRPLELVFFQNYICIKEARKIEYKLKKLKSRKIIEQIIADKKIKMGS